MQFPFGTQAAKHPAQGFGSNPIQPNPTENGSNNGVLQASGDDQTMQQGLLGGGTVPGRSAHGQGAGMAHTSQSTRSSGSSFSAGGFGTTNYANDHIHGQDAGHLGFGQHSGGFPMGLAAPLGGGQQMAQFPQLGGLGAIPSGKSRAKSGPLHDQFGGSMNSTASSTGSNGRSIGSPSSVGSNSYFHGATGFGPGIPSTTGSRLDQNLAATSSFLSTGQSVGSTGFGMTSDQLFMSPFHSGNGNNGHNQFNSHHQSNHHHGTTTSGLLGTKQNDGFGGRSDSFPSLDGFDGVLGVGPTEGHPFGYSPSTKLPPNQQSQPKHVDLINGINSNITRSSTNDSIKDLDIGNLKETSASTSTTLGATTSVGLSSVSTPVAASSAIPSMDHSVYSSSTTNTNNNTTTTINDNRNDGYSLADPYNSESQQFISGLESSSTTDINDGYSGEVMQTGVYDTATLAALAIVGDLIDVDALHEIEGQDADDDNLNGQRSKGSTIGSLNDNLSGYSAQSGANGGTVKKTKIQTLLSQLPLDSQFQALTAAVDQKMKEFEMMADSIPVEIILHQAFPQIGNEFEIANVLNRINYDVHDISKALRQGNIDKVESRAVCRHFLQGNCRRSDCVFSHDVKGKVCKFWMNGSCLKGPDCEFMHGVDVFNHVKVELRRVVELIVEEALFGSLEGQISKLKTEKEQKKIKDQEFPTLGAMLSTKKSSTNSSSSSLSTSAGQSTNKSIGYYEDPNSIGGVATHVTGGSNHSTATNGGANGPTLSDFITAAVGKKSNGRNKNSSSSSSIASSFSNQQQQQPQQQQQFQHSSGSEFEDDLTRDLVAQFERHDILDPNEQQQQQNRFGAKSFYERSNTSSANSSGTTLAGAANTTVKLGNGFWNPI